MRQRPKQSRLRWAINDTARGDPDALAGRIIAALAKAGYRVVSRKSLIALLEELDGDEETKGMTEAQNPAIERIIANTDSAQGSQPFAKLTREKRPQDPHGDGRDWKFITCEHGGDEPDNMPQAIEATDAAGRWAIYVPLTRDGKIVIPRPQNDL